ncbi:MAG TPA: hypothetical protein VN634_17415 [Candidatus Limnocylindrales bacterium]|nr:hypothetical protein [Candidatus Limnocylindrales bacterium]
MKPVIIRAAHVVALIALFVASAGAVDVDNVSAKKMKIKDNADAEKRKVQLLVQDAAIAPSDGYANASVTAAEFVAFSPTTGESATWTSTTCTGDGAENLTCGKEIAISPGKLKVKVQPLADRRFNLDGLVDQLPVSMAIRVHSADDTTSVYYCAVCGNGGADVAKKNGTDGKSVMATKCDIAPCAVLNTGGCCSNGSYCAGGGAADPFACLTDGTITLANAEAGAANTICDASGTCVAPPGTGGTCCQKDSLSYCGTKWAEGNCSDFSGTFSYPRVCNQSGSCVVP